MKFRLTSGYWALLLASAILLAGRIPSTPEEQLDVRRLESELRFLASDELGGRATGSVGADSAARFIAETFREAGVQPPPGQTDFLQTISFQRLSAPDKITFTIQDRTFETAQMAWLGGDQADLEGVAIFSESWQPELAGKIWLTPVSMAGGVSRLQETLSAKNSQASEGGALALVQIFSGDSGWTQLRAFLTRERTVLRQPETRDIPHLILATKTTFPGQPLQSRLLSTPVDVKNFTSSNVVGMIEGSDADLRKDYIGLVAHYDHLGQTSEATPGRDKIFNGARDNGMGVVALLGAARALGEIRPRRSVLLLAVTGEELGLLGSRFFVENSPIPLPKIRYILNVDGAGFTDTDVVTVIGFQRTDASRVIARAASDFGLEAIPEPEAASGLFARSDNFSFAEKGVPAVTLSPGFREMNQSLMKYYHQTSDEADDSFDYDYLVHFVRVFARASRYLANSERSWNWTPGDPFENTGRILYGLP